MSAGICPPDIEIFPYFNCKLLGCKGKAPAVFRERGAQPAPSQAGSQQTRLCSQGFGIFLAMVSLVSMQQGRVLKSVAKARLDLQLGEDVLEFLRASPHLSGLLFNSLCSIISLRGFISSVFCFLIFFFIHILISGEVWVCLVAWFQWHI